MDEAAIRALHSRLGFPAVDKLLPAAKREAARLNVAAPTRAEVAAAVRKSDTAQVFAPPRASKGAVFGMAPREHMQADIVVLTSLGAVKGNRGYQNVLLAIDVFTRKAFAVASKDRNDDTMKAVFQKIFTDAGGAPKVLSSDDESGFKGPEERDLFATRGVIHRTKDPADRNAVAVADAGVLTFKKILFRQLTEANSAIWHTRVPAVLEAMNSRQHGTVGGPANDVEGNEQLELLLLKKNSAKLEGNAKLYQRRRHNLEVGDKFRVLKKRKQQGFQRGYVAQYGRDVKTVRRFLEQGRKVEAVEGGTFLTKLVLPVDEQAAPTGRALEQAAIRRTAQVRQQRGGQG